MNRRQLTKGLAGSFALSRSPQLTAQQSRSHAAFQATSLSWSQVLPGIWKARLGTPERYTPVSSRAIQPAAAALGSLTPVSQPPIDAPRGITTDRGCVLRLPLKADEMVYGFGLQLLSFAQRGKKKTIRVNADPKVDTGDSHAPVPFYVTTFGYGVLIDSTRHVDFYCGDARPKPTKALPVGSSEVNTPESTRNLPLEEPGEITVEVPHAQGVDIYLFAGPTMAEAVQRYNLFSGGGLIPPEWGLGFWYRADGRADQGAVKAIAKEFRDRKIPCDVLGLEPGWQTHSYSCSFAWDPTRFPDPKTFVQDLGQQQFKVNLWEHAFTHPSSPLFEPLRTNSGDYGVWGGLAPDFAAEPARKIFGDYHGRNLIDLGISGFKLDECDGSDFTGGWSFPDITRFPSGIDGEQMHAVFGLRYQDTIWQQFRARNRATYSLVRSSGALAAPYPFVLYSDLYGHRDFIRALVNSGFSGLLWCPEVRDAKDEEDLIRRLESVVFSPLAMVNAWYIKNPPWKQIEQKKNNDDRFADNWTALESRCRSIIEWRMRLVPYLRSAFAKYALDGTPPFRALVMDYPDDKSLHVVDSEYMMGDRVLVAPLFADEESREVVLPQGTWHDFWSGQVFQGGRSYTIPGSQENIPVFVKSGSIVPLGGVALTTTSEATRVLTVLVYGDGSLPWRLEGESGL